MKLTLEERVHELRTPLASAHGVVSVRNLLVVRAEDGEGLTGWGEASPVAGYSEADIDQCRAALERIIEQTASCDPDDPESTLSSAGSDLPAPARAGFECALRDLAARRAGTAMIDTFGGAAVERVRLRALLPGNSTSDLQREAIDAAGAGFRDFKIKLGADAELDERRSAIVRSAAGADAHICGDANCGWSTAQASDRIERLRPGLIDLIEQPVHGVEAMRSLRSPRVNISLDEDATAAGALDSPAAAEAICIKVQAWGGIDRALRAAERARASGLAVYFGSSLEGAVGTAASLVAAQAFGPDLASGVDTLDLYEWDFPVFAGRLPTRQVPAGPGLGTDPDGTAV